MASTSNAGTSTGTAYTAVDDKTVEQQATPPKSNRRTLVLVGVVGALAVVGLVVGLAVGLTRPSGSAVATLSENPRACVDKFDANTDYFPHKLDLYVPNPNFNVKYFKSYKVITNSLNPAAIETIVLYQCGAPKPTLDLNVTLYLPVPIKSIFVGDTTSISYLELLGVRDSIKVTDSLQYSTSPCLLQANSTGFGPIMVDGYVDAKKALEEAEKVDLSLDYLDSNTKKAKNYVTFPASADLSAYNRISWLGFLATFYNLESTANTLIKQLADNYNCIKSKQSSLSPRPSMAWIEYLPAQPYTLNTSVYVLNRWPVYVQYTLDAGATNVTVSLDEINKVANQTLADAIGTPYRSYFSDRTAFMNILKDVDIIIDETYSPTPASLEKVLATYAWTETSDFKFIKNKSIWRNDKRRSEGGSDWFESAVVSANLVLSDLAGISRGQDGGMYFRNAFKNATDVVLITKDMCGKTGKDAISVNGLGTEFGEGVKVVECKA